jgi:hypothetical protein
MHCPVRRTERALDDGAHRYSTRVPISGTYPAVRPGHRKSATVTVSAGRSRAHRRRSIPIEHLSLAPLERDHFVACHNWLSRSNPATNRDVSHSEKKSRISANKPMPNHIEFTAMRPPKTAPRCISTRLKVQPSLFCTKPCPITGKSHSKTAHTDEFRTLRLSFLAFADE